MGPVDFRPLFDDNPEPIVVFDPETRRLLRVNDAACRHFERSRESLVGRDVTSLRPPEEAAVELLRMRIDYEGRPAVLAVMQDVSARVRAEASLRDSEERYRLLFEATPIPIFVFDAETLRYLAANDAAVEKYGYTRDELLAMSVADIRPSGDVWRLREVLAQIDGANVSTGVWRHRKRDGTTFDVEIITHAVHFAGRKARLVVANDITERRRIDEQRRQSQKMEATGLLAGGVAHDFNNLLGVVLGAGELARRAAAAGQPTEPYLAEIDDAARRAAELTRKLLTFSREQALHVRTLDLLVGADASQIEQVLLNLCTNARQVMPVESQSGAGTMVRVCPSLAGTTDGQTQERTPPEGVAVSGGRETILVAEDEPPLRRLLAMTLAELGYEVVTASNGEEAARAFEANHGRVSLAILDVVMPQLGGVQAYERMRAVDPSLKVIFMTGYAPEHAQVSDILRQGGRALLLKPFALKDLTQKVRETLDGR